MGMRLEHNPEVERLESRIKELEADTTAMAKFQNKQRDRIRELEADLEEADRLTREKTLRIQELEAGLSRG